jgi:hypothetical protein
MSYVIEGGYTFVPRLGDYYQVAEGSSTLNLVRLDYFARMMCDLGNVDTLRNVTLEATVRDSSSITPFPKATSKNATFQDLWTGETVNIRISLSSALRHADWTPATVGDTAKIMGLLNPEGQDFDWSLAETWRDDLKAWDARPGILYVDGEAIVVSFHLFPHGSIMPGAKPGDPLVSQSNIRPSDGWQIGGHMCMYFGPNTLGGTQAARDMMARMINAYRLNP